MNNVVVKGVVVGGVVVGCVVSLVGMWQKWVWEHILTFSNQYLNFLWSYQNFRNNMVLLIVVFLGVVVGV